MTGILDFQNRIILVKVMPCFIKLEKIRILANVSFSKYGKFSDVPLSIKTHFDRPCARFFLWQGITLASI